MIEVAPDAIVGNRGIVADNDPGHEGLLLPERFLDSSTPQPEAFTCPQDQTEISHNLDRPPRTAQLSRIPLVQPL
jgi:hypothetical protein